MQKEERHKRILEMLEKEQRVYVSELSNRLKVSDDTLRRDFVELEKEGLLTKIHGGAVQKSKSPHDFDSRKMRSQGLKTEMAAKIIPFFKDGDVILIDGGTSNLEVVRQLPDDKKFTIYTNSFPLVMELMYKPNIDVEFLGGSLFRSSQVTVGVPVFKALMEIHADWLVLGVCSIHPTVGLTVPDREEAVIKRSMIDRANKTIVIADTLKLSVADNYVIGNLNEINYLVVEDGKVLETREKLEKYKCEVI